MKTHSQKFLQQRKLLTVLPLIILPFWVFLFWLLGGGTSGKDMGLTKTGLNTELPGANLKSQSALDKLSFYAMADRDSVKRVEQERMDPNYQPKPFENLSPTDGSDEMPYRKAEKLQKQVEQPEYDERPFSRPVIDSPGEIERLQMMIQSISQRKADPEIEALNGTLDKLLEIQNPTRTRQVTDTDQRKKRFAVETGESLDERSYFGAASKKSANPFLSDRDETRDSANAGTILAVVHSAQTLVAGSVVKLRLLQDVFVNGERIPAGSFVFGNSSIDRERLKIVISSIQFQHHLYPVALSVFDMDGLEGIHIPGSPGIEVMKQSADQGVQSVGGLSFDPTLKAQAAAAGVNAAKTLFSIKIKPERVTVKAGYQVLLRDDNDKSNQ